MTRDDYINITCMYNRFLYNMTNVSGHKYMEYMYRSVRNNFSRGGGVF